MVEFIHILHTFVILRIQYVPTHTQINFFLEFDIFSLQNLQTSLLDDVNIHHLSRSLSPRIFVIVFEWNCPSIDGWIDDLASTEIW